MRLHHAFLASVLGLAAVNGVVAPAVTHAQDTAAGKLTSGFRSFIVRDDRYPVKDDKNRSGRMHCLVCENGLSPQIAIFSRSIPKDASAPLVQLMQKQDALVKQFTANKLGSFVIFPLLTKPFSEDETRENRKDELANFGRVANVKSLPIGLAEANSSQSQAFKLDAADDITVILIDKLNEVQRWKFPADKLPTEEDIKAIEAAVVKYLKK